MWFDYDPAFRHNEKLSRELRARISELPPAEESAPAATEPAAAKEPVVLHGADALIAHVEVNDKHGTGVLVQRLFSGYRNIISIRSRDIYDGKQDFGDLALRISHGDKSRREIIENVRRALGPHTVGRILCIPYLPDDLRTALALREIFRAPLCTYLMDDQNICVGGIPDELMRELLENSALRLAISPELAIAYELKYGLKIALMPPVISARHIFAGAEMAGATRNDPRTGVILGNIWGRRWLDLLRQVVSDSGITLRLYSNSYFMFLSGTRAVLERDSIIVHRGPPLPDDEMVEVLRKAAFVVVPSGTLDKHDDRRFVAQLSLPSRIPFILATSHTPVLVLGSPQTAAGRFVEELGIGLVADYERKAFQRAVAEITEPNTNLAMRRRALAVAGRFTDVGAAEWIWQSLALGRPFDLRYEDRGRRPRPDIEKLVRSGRKTS